MKDEQSGQQLLSHEDLWVLMWNTNSGRRYLHNASICSRGAGIS